MKRAIKIVAILVACFLLLLLAVGILVRLLITPERVKAVVIPRAEAALQRKVVLDEVEISLFTGIRLNRLRVFEPDGSEPFVAADSVVLRYQLWPLLFKRIVIDEVRLVSPSIRVERRADGTFNFSDLLAREKPEAAVPPEESRGEPIDLLVSKIEVSDGRLLFLDHQLGGSPSSSAISIWPRSPPITGRRSRRR
jgi:AsmA protein